MPYDMQLDQGSPSTSSQKVANSARNATAVTPGDTASSDLSPYSKALYFGGAGTVRLLMVGPYSQGQATTVDFVVAAGQILPVQAARVFSTGTTATAIVNMHG